MLGHVMLHVVSPSINKPSKLAHNYCYNNNNNNRFVIETIYSTMISTHFKLLCITDCIGCERGVAVNALDYYTGGVGSISTAGDVVFLRPLTPRKAMWQTSQRYFCLQNIFN